MEAAQPKTFDSIADINEGGCYEERDGKFVRVVEPTAPSAAKGAEAEPGGAVGAASGDPPARAKASRVAPDLPAAPN